MYTLKNKGENGKLKFTHLQGKILMVSLLQKASRHITQVWSSPPVLWQGKEFALINSNHAYSIHGFGILVSNVMFLPLALGCTIYLGHFVCSDSQLAQCQPGFSFILNLI